MSQLKTTYRISLFLLLCTYLMYTQQVLMYTHSHYINGVKITHAHPFSGKYRSTNSPLKTHTHTSGEFLFLSQISDITSTSVEIATATFQLQQTRSNIWIERLAVRPEITPPTGNISRAPPVA